MIISAHFEKLEQKCLERDWTLDEVMGCVVSKNGNIWTIDTEHPQYPMFHKSGRVGSELKKLLSRIGIVSTPSCSCNKKALIMDQMGVVWCENNRETILDWLKTEASKRHLPFSKTAASLLLNLALRNAKKNRLK